LSCCISIRRLRTSFVPSDSAQYSAPAPMNHVKIFKGWPPQDAPSKLVQLWYKLFPSDQRGQVEIKKPTRLSNKTSTAWSCAEDQILENKNLRKIILNICTERWLKYFTEINLPVREHTWLIGSGGSAGSRESRCTCENARAPEIFSKGFPALSRHVLLSMPFTQYDSFQVRSVSLRALGPTQRDSLCLVTYLVAFTAGILPNSINGNTTNHFGWDPGLASATERTENCRAL